MTDERTDRPTDGPTKHGVESRSTQLKIECCRWMDQQKRGGVATKKYMHYRDLNEKTELQVRDSLEILDLRCADVRGR